MSHKPRVLAIDAGGTMTDTFLIDASGEFVVGKAQTRPEDESAAFMNSFEDALRYWGRMPAEEALPEWMELREFYCPGCFALLEVEAVPPGYPIVFDFLPDLETFCKDWLNGGGQNLTTTLFCCVGHATGCFRVQLRPEPVAPRPEQPWNGQTLPVNCRGDRCGL